MQQRIQNYRPLVAREIDNSLIVARSEFWVAFKNADVIVRWTFPE